MQQLEPSIGMDAETGRVLAGWEHVVQSIKDILSTNFGERIMREWYGSFVPALLGSQLNNREALRFFAALTSALEQWEPRYRIVRIVPMAVQRDGVLRLQIEGEFRPRALFGDLTPDSTRRLVLMPGLRGVIVDGEVV